ncbi:putative defense protein 3 [Patella vulgata]|uniref:putative defense protein 3 n=1 Tax=Patella vulgata TaxID=6465 RepID=UPI0024A8CEF7|nr:putative defense protein 3 [Patella vulgata]
MDASLFKCLVLVGAVCRVYSYGDGAPLKACVNLMPQHHGIDAQPPNSPYTIMVSSTTYHPSQQIKVAITGGGNHRGLLVQARTSNSITPVGTFFSPSANTKTTKCNATADSWTHSSDAEKNSSTVTWTAPSTDMGQITFKATIAKDKNHYWLNHESAAIRYTSGTTNIQFGVDSVLAVVISVFYL